MVKGLQRLRDHFRDHGDAFVLIGGVASDEWLALQGLRFRPTRDVDMVLVLEALSPAFVSRFCEFIRAGQYDNRRRSTGTRVYYRFSKPAAAGYPAMLEIFARRPDELELAAGQPIAPIVLDEELSGLSAILMDDAYYRLILDSRTLSDGLPIVTAAALIPLKARAWLDLTHRRNRGEAVDEDDIRKHRRDVFRLTAALPAIAGPALAPSVRADLQQFVAAFGVGSPDWPDVLKSLKADLGAAVPPPKEFIAALNTYFALAAEP